MAKLSLTKRGGTKSTELWATHLELLHTIGVKDLDSYILWELGIYRYAPQNFHIKGILALREQADTIWDTHECARVPLGLHFLSPKKLQSVIEETLVSNVSTSIPILLTLLLGPKRAFELTYKTHPDSLEELYIIGDNLLEPSKYIPALIRKAIEHKSTASVIYNISPIYYFKYAPLIIPDSHFHLQHLIGGCDPTAVHSEEILQWLYRLPEHEIAGFFESWAGQYTRPFHAWFIFQHFHSRWNIDTLTKMFESHYLGCPSDDTWSIFSQDVDVIINNLTTSQTTHPDLFNRMTYHDMIHYATILQDIYEFSETKFHITFN